MLNFHILFISLGWRLFGTSRRIPLKQGLSQRCKAAGLPRKFFQSMGTVEDFSGKVKKICSLPKSTKKIFNSVTLHFSRRFYKVSKILQNFRSLALLARDLGELHVFFVDIHISHRFYHFSHSV